MNELKEKVQQSRPTLELMAKIQQLDDCIAGRTEEDVYPQPVVVSRDVEGVRLEVYLQVPICTKYDLSANLEEPSQGIQTMNFHLKREGCYTEGYKILYPFVLQVKPSTGVQYLRNYADSKRYSYYQLSVNPKN
jgi:hypothetical protein